MLFSYHTEPVNLVRLSTVSTTLGTTFSAQYLQPTTVKKILHIPAFVRVEDVIPKQLHRIEQDDLNELVRG